MREKLKTLGLKLTELSNYLGYSRPTLYKYLEDYEKKQYKQINFRVKKVFDFIMKKRTLSKIEVINYILQLDSEVDKTSFDILVEELKKDEKLVQDISDYVQKHGQDKIIKKIKKYLKESSNND